MNKVGLVGWNYWHRSQTRHCTMGAAKSFRKKDVSGEWRGEDDDGTGCCWRFVSLCVFVCPSVSQYACHIIIVVCIFTPLCHQQ